jgi:hypothetical protein
MSELRGGIWPPFEVFYIHSMMFNTQSAVSSIEALEVEFQKMPDEYTVEDLEQLNTELILNSLQNLIVQAAAISRYFWPVRKSHEWRGTQLRNAFKVREDSPLKSRDLRNAIEHFDEKLDKYLEGGLVGVVLPQFVGPRPHQESVPGHFFRAYYLDEGKFQLLGECYDVSPIAKAVLEVHNQLQEFDKNGGRLPNNESRNA